MAKHPHPVEGAHRCAKGAAERGGPCGLEDRARKGGGLGPLQRAERSRLGLQLRFSHSPIFIRKTDGGKL